MKKYLRLVDRDEALMSTVLRKLNNLSDWLDTAQIPTSDSFLNNLKTDENRDGSRSKSSTHPQLGGGGGGGWSPSKKNSTTPKKSVL